MPKISQFHGVAILLYFQDHAPPHFHAMHGDDEAVITIAPPGVYAGALPGKSLKRVLTWTGLNQTALLANWQLGQLGQPLNSIPPLP